MKSIIELDFIRSWDDIEKFYHDVSKMNMFMPKPDIPAILNFINQMRMEGYDKVFRAGQMLLSLVLSRSLRHGLRIDQPFFALEFHKGEIKIISEKWQVIYISSNYEFTPQIKMLLKELEAHEID